MSQYRIKLGKLRIGSGVGAQVGRARFFAGASHGEPGRLPPAKPNPLPFFTPGSQKVGMISPPGRPFTFNPPGYTDSNRRTRVGHYIVDSGVGEPITATIITAGVTAAVTEAKSFFAKIASWFKSKGSQQLADRKNIVNTFVSEKKSDMDSLMAKVKQALESIGGSSIDWNSWWTSAAFQNGTKIYRDTMYDYVWANAGWVWMQQYQAKGDPEIQDAFFWYNRLTGGPEWPEKVSDTKTYGPHGSISLMITDFNSLVSGMQGGSGSGGGGVTITVPASRPTLRVGSTGNDVTTLQSFLISMGYDTGTADGIFGSKTQTALKAFQAKYGLSADGICGVATWAKIAQLLGGNSGTIQPQGGAGGGAGGTVIIIKGDGSTTTEPAGGAGSGGGAGGGTASGSLFSKPLFWIASLAGLALVGGGGYAVTHRKKKQQIVP